MSWKYYKKIFESGSIDENKFVLGIDLGSSSSAIAFFNTITEEPELIDLSGGYGRPSMPSVIQYIPETREWVFGEYALLNRGLFNDHTFLNFMNKIGRKEYVEIGSKTVSAVWLLSKYIKELMESLKSINPSAEIAGIVCVTPTYASAEAREELRSAFRGAGLEKQLIGFITARESVLIHNQFRFGREEKIIAQIDYGARKMRASIDRLTLMDEDGGGSEDGGIHVVTESYYEDEALGFDQTEAEIADLFIDIYCAEKRMDRKNLTEHEINQLHIFTHQNKAQMFKTSANNKPSKLYFNFAFPPFVKELENSVKLEFINKLEIRIERLIKKLFENSKSNIETSDIDRVICLGGGFESPFAKDFIEKVFPGVTMTLLKNGKAMLAEGASIYAAKRLGLYKGSDFYIDDNALLKSDIGVKVRHGGGERFYPIAERNTFWWKARGGAVFTLANAADAESLLRFYLRGASGEETPVCEMGLDGLEKRPKGVTRLEIKAGFAAYGQLFLSVEDFGFGEMFPKTDFRKEITLDLTAKGISV